MKIIVRTLIILVAALIVVAAAVGFAQSSFAVALAPGMPAEERGAAPVLVTSADTTGTDATVSTVTFTTPDSATAVDAATADATGATSAAGSGAAPAFAGESSHGGHGEAGGIQGALPLAKNFAMMALIVGVVALASQGAGRLRQYRMHLQAR